MKSAKRWIGNIFSSGSLLFCLIIYSVVIIVAYIYLPARVSYRIREQYRFYLDGECKSTYLGLLLPKSGPYQTVSNRMIFWDGELETETYEIIDEFRFWRNESNKEVEVILVQYDVRIPQGVISWDNPVEEYQITPQRGIESTHPEIKKQATEIVNNTSNPDIVAIYNFTSDYLDFSYEFRDCTSASALDAYRLGKAVCAGYARLMVAFSRAAGIPSQVVIGSTLPDQISFIPRTCIEGVPGCGHAWVEFYTDGHWSLADPSYGDSIFKRIGIFRNNGRYLSYGEIDAHNSRHEELKSWALEQGVLLENELNYVAASNSESTKFSEEIKVTKKWDGRWFNTLLIWVAATFFLCRLRDRIFLM